MKRVYLSLGGNQGDRIGTLRRAVEQLKELPGTVVEALSPVYETEPQGYRDQPEFLNMAVRIRTSLSPMALLRETAHIEDILARKRTIKDGPRTIDIDLLLYEGVEMSCATLTLPHPRMRERAFVLIPLGDIWAEEKPLPRSSKNIAGQGISRYCDSWDRAEDARVSEKEAR